jgi:hypothetical protein
MVWLSLSEKDGMQIVTRRIVRSTDEITAACESMSGEC